MSKTVPPSMFFGKRTTRGQTQGMTECATSLKSNACKASSHEEGLQQRYKGERNLRSAVKQSSKLISENVITPAPHLGNTTQSRRACKNSRLNSPHHQRSKSCIQAPRAETHSTKADSDKNVVTQNDKNPVYKLAKCERSLVQSTVEDEYEFQAETPQGLKKKLKKRQPRQKNTMQTLWGLKVRPETKKKFKLSTKVFIQEPENEKAVKMIQPTIASKDLLIAAKKTLAPLQEITGNTLCSVVTSSIHDNRSDNLVSSLDVKKKADESTSKNVNKCPKYDQSDKNMKENTPVVLNKASGTSGTKCFPTPIKENVSTSHSNSTPQQSLLPLAINNMSFLLSPIHGDCHTNKTQQNTTSTPRQNSIHASTPLKSNICSKTSVNISRKNTCFVNDSQSKIQMSIPNHEFQLCTFPSTGKGKPPTQSQNNQHHSTERSSDFVDNRSISVLASEVVNNTERLPLPSKSGHIQYGRRHFKEQNSKKEFPVPQACTTWRLGSTARYDFNLKLTLENCFGFKDDSDINHMDVLQSNQPVIPDVTSSLFGMKTCGQPEKKTCDQFQGMNVPQSQVGINPLPEKQWFQREMCSQLHTKRSPSCVKISLNGKNTFELKKQVESAKQQVSFKPVKLQEKHVNDELTENASSLKQDIGDLLSSSLMKLRKKKTNTEHTIYSNILPPKHFESTLSSQLNSLTSSQCTSRDCEDTITGCKNLLTLFDDITEDDNYKSPFSEPPRRSYACVRPMKRLALEEDEELGEERQRPTPAKRNKTVCKRKKVMQTTSLDQWAKVLSSHFAEVDDVDLITE